MDPKQTAFNFAAIHDGEGVNQQISERQARQVPLVSDLHVRCYVLELPAPNCLPCDLGASACMWRIKKEDDAAARAAALVAAARCKAGRRRPQRGKERGARESTAKEAKQRRQEERKREKEKESKHQLRIIEGSRTALISLPR